MIIYSNKFRNISKFFFKYWPLVKIWKMSGKYNFHTQGLNRWHVVQIPQFTAIIAKPLAIIESGIVLSFILLLVLIINLTRFTNVYESKTCLMSELYYWLSYKKIRNSYNKTHDNPLDLVNSLCWAIKILIYRLYADNIGSIMRISH